MDISKLIRDPKRIHACLTELPDGILITSKRLVIYVPYRWEERELLVTSGEALVLGIHAIVLDDMYYCINNIPAMIPIQYSELNKVDINGEVYYELIFNAGSALYKTTNLVKRDVLAGSIFDEFITKGRIPWYLEYNDLCKVYTYAKYHADANVGEQREVTELLISIIARDSKDRKLYYRHVTKTPNDLKIKKPIYVSLKSIPYTATDTVTKLGGSYFEVGLVSALVDPADRVETVEEILRQ